MRPGTKNKALNLLLLAVFLFISLIIAEVVYSLIAPPPIVPA